jgi:hypothetical protein
MDLMILDFVKRRIKMADKKQEEKKIQTEEPTERKSKISKRISRTFRIGEYKSLVVDVNYEEEIDWSTLPERMKKSENITKLLLTDFQKTVISSFEELGLVEKKATYKDSSSSSPKKIDLPDEDLIKQLDCDSLDVVKAKE